MAALWITVASGCDGESPNGEGSASDTESAETDGPSSGPTGDPTTDTDTDADTDTDTDTDTDDDAEPGVDLFACDLELACEQVIWHLDPEPASATECIATRMASQAPGAFSVLETLGPDVYEDESISIIRGDGTIVRQVRHRECVDCDASTLPWEVEAPQLCRVRVDTERYQGCLEGTYECLATYAIEDCEPLEDASCEGALEDLQGEAPALVECGETSCPFGTVCVQEPAACECDPKTGEYDYVAVTPTCHNAPDDCGDDQDTWDVECVGALCGSGGHEFDGLADGLLTCGQDAGDCFGEC